MADAIFGQGLDPIPLKLVQTPTVIPEFGADPIPVQVQGLGNVTATKMTAQADSTATTIAGLVTDFNALLAKLRAAGLMAP